MNKCFCTFDEHALTRLVKNYLQITQSKLINSIHKYVYHAQLQISFILLPLHLPTHFTLSLNHIAATCSKSAYKIAK